MNGLGAFACGIGLIVTDGSGMSSVQLADSPFYSFVIPGLLLTAVVGRSLLDAAWLTWTGHFLPPLASLGAGCILLGWIVVEAVMVDGGRGLQIAVFVLASFISHLSWRQMPRDLRHPNASNSR